MSESLIFHYECQELAMAPGIGDGWPEVIPAPHTPNARLVRKEGSVHKISAELAAMTKRAELAEKQRDAALGLLGRYLSATAGMEELESLRAHVNTELVRVREMDTP